MVSKFSEESFQSAWRAPGPVQSSLDGDGTEAEAERVRATGVAQGGGGDPHPMTGHGYSYVVGMCVGR